MNSPVLACSARGFASRPGRRLTGVDFGLELRREGRVRPIIIIFFLGRGNDRMIGWSVVGQSFSWHSVS
jgi:hypothetical protein